MVGKERSLAMEGSRADRVLDAIGTDLDPAAGQEGLQVVSAATDAAELCACEARRPTGSQNR